MLVLIAGGTILRIAVAAMIGLGNGESYYFSCSKHPDLSYFDHPPMHAWLAHLATELGGCHPLVLRAPFIAFFVFTTWLVFVLGRRLFSAWAGFFAALILNLSPVFSLTTAICLQPDSPLMFFWLLAFYGLANLLLDAAPRHATWCWLGIGAALGAAMLCKYHAVFLVVGAAVFVATRKDQRHWLWHPGPYMAIALAGLVFAPVLIWNARYEWISFLWQGERGATCEGLRWDWLARSIGGQALWLLPWIWAPLVWELAVCMRRGPSDAVRWLIASIAAPPILFFTITALYAPYGFHFHWQAPGYLLLFLPLGATVAHRLTNLEAKSGRTRLSLRFTVVASLLAFVGLTTHTVSGWLTEVMPEKYANQFAVVDPTLEALDYGPLEAELARLGLLDRPNTFAFTSKWYLSGKVDYALRGKMRVLCLSSDDPRAFAFFDAQEQFLGMDGILVTHPRFSDGAEQFCTQYFEKVTYLGSVGVPRGGRIAIRLNLFLAENFRETIRQPYGKSRETKVAPNIARSS